MQVPLHDHYTQQTQRPGILKQGNHMLEKKLRWQNTSEINSVTYLVIYHC